MTDLARPRAAHGHGAAVLAGFLGWTLDAFDFFLVVFALTAIAKEFNTTDASVALSITLTLAGRELEIDFRPSDAIALAVRSGAPIYAA